MALQKNACFVARPRLASSTVWLRLSLSASPAVLIVWKGRSRREHLLEPNAYLGDFDACDLIVLAVLSIAVFDYRTEGSLGAAATVDRTRGRLSFSFSLERYPI
jgi:hypothetical protein